MIKVDDLLDAKKLGTKFLLTAIDPVYEYKNGEPTEHVIAYRYTVAISAQRLEKIGVRVDAPQRIASDAVMKDYPPVAFEGLELHVYASPNGKSVMLSGKANDVHLIGNKTAA